MNDYINAIRKYATFSGRARRREYWMFTLVNIVFAVLTFGIDIALLATVGIGGLNLLYSVALLLPAVAVSVRRLHDTGRSGWWILIAFVPVAGIVLLVFLCQDSQAGSNHYGPNPKETPEPSSGDLAALQRS
ncbi:MAG: DUF805 domain-containing protein [Pirellulaceae bacterium]